MQKENLNNNNVIAKQLTGKSFTEHIMFLLHLKLINASVKPIGGSISSSSFELGLKLNAAAGLEAVHIRRE